MKLIKFTTNYTSVDKFNAKIAEPLKSAVGQQIEVIKVAILEEEKEDGEKTFVSHFVTSDSSYVSISDLIKDQAESIIELLEESDSGLFEVKEKTSGNGRSYLLLKMV